MKNAILFVAVFTACLACFLAGGFLISTWGAVVPSQPVAQEVAPSPAVAESPAPDEPARPRRVRRPAPAPATESAVTDPSINQAEAAPVPAAGLQDDFRASSVNSNLKTLRSQIQLYKAQHNDQWPTDFEAQMTKYTDADGNVSDTQSAQYRFGPYLLRIPPNAYTGQAAVATESDANAAYLPAGTLRGAWWYNSATGEFRSDTPDSLVAPDGVQVNEM